MASESLAKDEESRVTLADGYVEMSIAGPNPQPVRVGSTYLGPIVVTMIWEKTTAPSIFRGWLV